MKRVLGKVFRKGISVIRFIEAYSTERKAEWRFIRNRWPNGICCRRYKSTNLQTGCGRPALPFRYREKACGRPRLSPDADTVIEGLTLRYQDRVIAMCWLITSLKSASIIWLHCDLVITQKSALFLASWPRDAQLRNGTLWFDGPVEVGVTYMGGRRRDMSDSQREALARSGRDVVGETAVLGAKDRAPSQVAATFVASTNGETAQGFVRDHTAERATVYTDDASAYQWLPYSKETVKCLLSGYVTGDIHISAVESIWSLHKRTHRCTVHKLSLKSLDRRL